MGSSPLQPHENIERKESKVKDMQQPPESNGTPAVAAVSSRSAVFGKPLHWSELNSSRSPTASELVAWALRSSFSNPYGELAALRYDPANLRQLKAMIENGFVEKLANYKPPVEVASSKASHTAAAPMRTTEDVAPGDVGVELPSVVVPPRTEDLTPPTSAFATMLQAAKIAAAAAPARPVESAAQVDVGKDTLAPTSVYSLRKYSSSTSQAVGIVERGGPTEAAPDRKRQRDDEGYVSEDKDEPIDPSRMTKEEFMKQIGRVPLRGEIGITADEISVIESQGYVMSGSRNRGAVRYRDRVQQQLHEKQASARHLAFLKESDRRCEEQSIDVFVHMIEEALQKKT